MEEQFCFKQFVVHQDLCGMKVGTDGVLLGAWARGGKRVLDIGSGTGLIALMMAQRYPQARITAIDIEPDACRQAHRNVELSPFAQCIEVENYSVQQFALHPAHHLLFDSIVSNPPFFVDSFKSEGDKRTLARHTDSLTFCDLFRSAAALLSPMGELSVVIPTVCLEEFEAESYIHGFLMRRKCWVKTVEHKSPKRCLLSFGKCRDGAVEEEEHCMLTCSGEKTPWYQTLTGDFYLK
ncbi:MAG: methyltransferase [Prevotella sp.]|nr:methyltransferase [Prevotella sp.]